MLTSISKAPSSENSTQGGPFQNVLPASLPYFLHSLYIHAGIHQYLSRQNFLNFAVIHTAEDLTKILMMSWHVQSGT